MTWLQEMRLTKSPATVRRYLSSLRGWMRWAGDTQPLLHYRPPRLDPREPHPLPGLDEDLVRMIDATHRQDLRALVALQGFCGLRVSEAITCVPNDFNLEAMKLTVYGKGGKKRIVPISDRAWSVLVVSIAERINSNRPLVPFGRRNASKLITELGAKIGIKASTHDLRATYATKALEACGNIHTVAVLLGHADVKTTMVYVRANEESMRKAANF